MKYILIVVCVLSIFSSFSQQPVALETQLTMKENKFYSNEKPFTGQIISLFDNGQQKSLIEVKDGLPNGKAVEYLFDNHFQKKNYQDSVEIRKFNKLISEKKAEIELNIQDTIKASKEEKEFLNYEIGGVDKLVKLKEKNDEGKLNQKKKEEFDKYELLVQIKNKSLRKLKDSQQALIELNQNVKEETNKPIYFPIKAKEYEQINSVKEGKAIIYDSLGNKFGEGNYSNGKQDGEWVYYQGKGKLKGKGKFINGDGTDIGKSGVPKNGREGLWIFYFENDKMSEEATYKNGILSGTSNLYYSSGKIKETGNFIDNKISGKVLFYNEMGVKIQESSYSNGEKLGLQIIFDEEGKINSEYYLAANNLKNGLEKVYFKNGKLKEERNFKMGLRHGKVKTYHESGKLEAEGNFANDKAHGPITTYFENGKIKYKATFDTTSLAENNLIGDLYEYNEDGSIKLHAYGYKDGRLEDKTNSNSSASGTANSELKKPYKCKCCKSTIHGLQEGVDKDGGEYNDFYRQLCEQNKIFTAFGYQNVYEYFRVRTYKYCTMKCARTCYE